MPECKHKNQRAIYQESFLRNASTEELKDRERHFKNAPGWSPGGQYALQKFMQVYRQMSLAELRRRLGS
jgi:hypothetical protein